MSRARARSAVDSTFLSHASVDAELLPAVVKLLEDHGGEVYLDKLDSSLPVTTSRVTAEQLRTRIRQCSRFVLFATEKSRDSRWIPWELGVSDGIKGGRAIAVLPSVETATDTAWAEREYLGIYNRVVFGDLEGHSRKVWMVLNQEANSATELREWLTGR